jgi:hypothetical protein
MNYASRAVMDQINLHPDVAKAIDLLVRDGGQELEENLKKEIGPEKLNDKAVLCFRIAQRMSLVKEELGKLPRAQVVSAHKDHEKVRIAEAEKIAANLMFLDMKTLEELSEALRVSSNVKTRYDMAKE